VETVMKKQPDPSPPPKRSKEDRQFRSLLKKLVAIPAAEIQEKRREYHRKRKRKKT
jgi:hypothetical protein